MTNTNNNEKPFLSLAKKAEQTVVDNPDGSEAEIGLVMIAMLKAYADVNAKKEKAEIVSNCTKQLQKKDDDCAAKIEKLQVDAEKKATEDATTIGKLQADKKKWTAEKVEWTAELKQKDEALADFKMKLADFKTTLTVAEEGKATAEKAKTVAEEGRTAAEKGYNKKKADCQSLEKKLEGQLEAFAEEKKITRDNMKKRNEEELERYAEGAELRIKHAVASAVEEKDEVIEDLKRDNKLLRDYRRKSEGSTISNLPSA